MCSSGSSTMESPGDEPGRSAAPLTGAPPNGSNKIIGRNVNGTSKSHMYMHVASPFNCTQKWTPIYFAARLSSVACYYFVAFAIMPSTYG